MLSRGRIVRASQLRSVQKERMERRKPQHFITVLRQLETQIKKIMEVSGAHTSGGMDGIELQSYSRATHTIVPLSAQDLIGRAVYFPLMAGRVFGLALPGWPVLIRTQLCIRVGIRGRIRSGARLRLPGGFYEAMVGADYQQTLIHCNALFQ